MSVDDRVPDGRRHKKRQIAPIERKGPAIASVIADYVDQAGHADHELRAQPVRVFATLRIERRPHGKHSRNGEWHAGVTLGNNEFTAVLHMTRQIDQAYVTDIAQRANRFRNNYSMPEQPAYAAAHDVEIRACQAERARQIDAAP